MKAFSNGRLVLSLFSGFLAAATLAAQADVPIVSGGSTVANWTVPPLRAASAEGGLQTMTDITFGGTFVPMVPCRVFDTGTRTAPTGVLASLQTRRASSTSTAGPAARFQPEPRRFR